MRKLIITEKANAARRISAILSDGKSSSASEGGVTVISFDDGKDSYKVVSLRGHIMELDYSPDYNDWSAVPPADLVYAEQIKTVRVKSILNTLRTVAGESDEIIIATDYDREGELIGMETVAALGPFAEKRNGEEVLHYLNGNIPVKRAKFSALTKGEVEKAFSDLAEPDKRLSDAAETRQMIDLSWGAVLTRLISISSGQVGKNFMSVGRVQSPTLKLLVDRHTEIENFVPVPFWDVVGKFGMLAFRGDHEKNHFWNKEEADAVMERLKGETEGRVEECSVTTKEEYRPAPFDTTQMQVEANKIGISPTAAMKLAEDLYTGGYISYPRTENTEYPRTLNLRSVLEKFKDSEFGQEAAEILSQEKIVPSRGKRRTTDHPPIYPTAPASSQKMKGDKWKLYELIVRRFLATLSPNAESEITKCKIIVGTETFLAEGYCLKKQGWKKYYKKYLKAPAPKLPAMSAGDMIDIRSMSLSESETQPPYRYNQGSLIQEMDRLQLGTKSTRHDIIAKLFSRNYVQGNYLIPTASGIALTKSLEKHGGGITEPDMTSRLESDMLSIMNGERTLAEVVKESQDMLHAVAEKITEESDEIGEEIRNALHTQQHIGICPGCGHEMIIKRSKKWNFIGCTGYPECSNAFPIPNGAMIQPAETVCEECGLPQLKVIRKGNPPSIQCIDPKCPSNLRKTDLGACPACGAGRIRIKFSKQGKRFAGCSNWPACTQTYPLRPRGTVEPAGKICELCRSPVIRTGSFEECINTECPGRRKKSSGKDGEKKEAKPKKPAVRRTRKKPEESA